MFRFIRVRMIPKTHFTWRGRCYKARFLTQYLIYVYLIFRFFTLLGSYIIFGMAFQYASGKRGKRMFPNHDFWCVAIPGLCKVGQNKHFEISYELGRFKRACAKCADSHYPAPAQSLIWTFALHSCIL